MVLATVANSVVVLTDSTIEQVLAENPYVMIKFYAPWCGHCTRLAPDYERAAELVGNRAVIANLDCTTETNAAAKYQIQGYPSVFWFERGVKVAEYDGDRVAEDIANWVVSRIPIPIPEIVPIVEDTPKSQDL